MQKTARTEAFWRDFTAHSSAHAQDYVVAAFGDSPAMATELANLVVAGIKRATASLARDYADARERRPKVEDFVLLVDGAGQPRCIWRTTSVEIKPLNAVDERFARDEGEGDRSRTWWLDAHRAYFGRQAARDGFNMHDEIDTVFERFEIVWPPAIADRRQERPHRSLAGPTGSGSDADDAGRSCCRPPRP